MKTFDQFIKEAHGMTIQGQFTGKDLIINKQGGGWFALTLTPEQMQELQSQLNPEASQFELPQGQGQQVPHQVPQQRKGFFSKWFGR